MIDPVVGAVMRLGLAALLLSAAWHKLRDARAFRAAIDGYALLPPRAVPALAAGAVVAEVVLGMGLLLPRVDPLAAGGSALLLAIYTAAIALNLARGRTRIDCGCAGPAGAMPLSWFLVARNGLLIIPSILAALPAAPRILHMSDALIIAVATLTFALLYVAAETALVNAARWRNASFSHRAEQVSA